MRAKAWRRCRRTGRPGWTRWLRARLPWSALRVASGRAGRRAPGWSRRCIPFCRLGGKHRSFIEVHLAKSRRIGRLAGAALASRHHDQLSDPRPHCGVSGRGRELRLQGPLYLSPGRAIGLRLVPMARDLRFAWEEMPQQILDEQAQKVRESLHAALIGWADDARARAATTSTICPLQCLHPVGHWYEVPNLFKNGVLAALAARAARPAVPDGPQHRRARHGCRSGACWAG